MTSKLQHSILRKISKSARNKILILYYHRVIDKEDDFIPGITSKTFETQMNYLSRNFNLVSLNKIVDHIARGEELPDYSAVVTFDDGYRDVYTNAYPIFRKYNIPATVFLTFDYVDANQIPWWDKVSYMFKRTKENKFKWQLSGSKEYSLKTHSKKNKLANDVISQLTKVDEEKKNNLVKEISDQLNVNIPENSRLMLSWNEVKKMTETGVLFGSHTLTHPILTRISKDQVKHEFVRSREMLEQKIGCSVDHVCYPNGGKDDFDSEIKKIARESGYTCACTLIRGFNNSQSDLFELKRGHPSKIFTCLFAGL